MFNGHMIFTALQQHTHFTNALQTAGAKAFCHAATQTHMIQRGPVTYAARPASQHFTALRHISPSHICILNPDTPADHALKAAGFRQLMTPASVAEIDLTQPIRLYGKWRNALRKSQNTPIITHHRPFHLAADHWLFDADRTQQRRKKYRAMSHLIPLHWPAQDTLFSVAHLHGTPVAAMLFLIHDQTATYHIGWSDAQGRASCTHNLLLHEATTQLAAKGILRLDLGTIDTVNNAGLARFKIGAGATVRTLGGTWAALPLWAP